MMITIIEGTKVCCGKCLKAEITAAGTMLPTCIETLSTVLVILQTKQHAALRMFALISVITCFTAPVVRAGIVSSAKYGSVPLAFQAEIVHQDITGGFGVVSNHSFRIPLHEEWGFRIDLTETDGAGTGIDRLGIFFAAGHQINPHNGETLPLGFSGTLAIGADLHPLGTTTIPFGLVTISHPGIGHDDVYSGFLTYTSGDGKSITSYKFHIEGKHGVSPPDLPPLDLDLDEIPSPGSFTLLSLVVIMRSRRRR
jgi:hypothetical protein